MTAKPVYWPRKLSSKQGLLPVRVTRHTKRQAAKAAESKARAKRRAQRKAGVKLTGFDDLRDKDVRGAVEATKRGPFDHKKMEPNR